MYHTYYEFSKNIDIQHICNTLKKQQKFAKALKQQLFSFFASFNNKYLVEFKLKVEHEQRQLKRRNFQVFMTFYRVADAAA